MCSVPNMAPNTNFLAITVLTATYCTLVPADLPVPYCCPPMYMDCDKNVSNGCETNVASDPLNCGYCGSSCYISATKDTMLPRSTVYSDCMNGMCVYVCEEGRGNCDGDVFSNGCETDLRSGDLENCGECGMRCPDSKNSSGGAGDDIVDVAPVDCTTTSSGSGNLRGVSAVVGVVRLIGCLIFFA